MRSALILFLLAALAAPAPAGEDLEALCREADRRVKEGRLDEAARLYLKAAREHPSSAVPVVGLARIAHLQALERHDAALLHRAAALLKEASSRDPGYGGIFFLRGEISLAVGDHAGAARAFEGAIQRDHRTREARALLARSLVYAGADLARGGRVPLDEVIAWLGKARKQLEDLLRDDSRTQEEKRGFRRLWEMTLNNLAAVHQRARDLEKARAILEELVAADPGNARYRLALGLVLGDQRRYDEALEMYRSALSLPHDPDWVDPYRPMGVILSRRGKVEEAEKCFTTYLAARPEDAGGWLTYADHLLRHGKLEAAIAACTRSVELDRRPTAVRKLAAVLLRAGHGRRAAKWRALGEILARQAGEEEPEHR